MEGIIAIAVIWFVINMLTKGMKVSQSGRKTAPGRTRPHPPLTPTARPGGSGMPDWGDLMTMLGGEAPPPEPPTEPPEPLLAQGESAQAPPSGSLTGPTMMEVSLSMSEGGMIKGGAPMMGEGAPLPGHEGFAVAPPIPEIPAAAPLHSEAQPEKYSPAAMRSAVVWAEILAKPKAWRHCRGSQARDGANASAGARGTGIHQQ